MIAASPAASVAGVQSRCSFSGIVRSARIRFGSRIEGTLIRNFSRSSTIPHLVGAHEGDAGERKLERHRAGGGERRARGAESLVFRRLAKHDPRRHGPQRGARATSSSICGRVGRMAVNGPIAS